MNFKNLRAHEKKPEPATTNKHHCRIQIKYVDEGIEKGKTNLVLPHADFLQCIIEDLSFGGIHGTQRVLYIIVFDMGLQTLLNVFSVILSTELLRGRHDKAKVKAKGLDENAVMVTGLVWLFMF